MAPARLTTILLAVTSIWIRSATAQTQPAASPQPRNARQQVLDARNLEEARTAYASLFKGMDEDGLRRASEDPDLGIALHAEWLLAHWRGRGGEGRGAHRFLGFLEGRTRLTTPLRWEISMTYGNYHGSRSPSDAVRPYLPNDCLDDDRKSGLVCCRYGPLVATGMGLWAPKGVSVKERGDHVLVSKGGSQAVLAKAEIASVVGERGEVNAIASVFTKKHCYISLSHLLRGFPSKLLCFDLDTRKARWQTDVWGCTKDFPYVMGVGGHDISLVADDEHVLLFGSASHDYVEGFDARTGKNWFRFIAEPIKGPDKAKE